MKELKARMEHLQQARSSSDVDMWVFPKIKGTFLGVPIMRTVVYWGLYWGTLILRNYHVGFKGLWGETWVSAIGA